MAKVVVLLRGLKPSTPLIVLAFLIFLLTFFGGLGWALWALRTGEEIALEPIIALWATGLLLFFAILIYGAMKRTGAVRGALEEFARKLQVIGSELVFPRTARVQIGRVAAWGSVSAYMMESRDVVTYPRAYHFLSEFRPDEDLGEMKAIDLGLLSKPFTFLAHVERGYLSAPAIRIELPSGEALVIAVLDPSTMVFERDKISLRVVSEQDKADASIKLEGARLRGVMNRPVVGRARGARLELHGHVRAPVPRATWPMNEVEIYEKTVLAEVCEKPSLRFEHVFPPGELTIIITHEEGLDPVALATELGLHSPVITGFSEGHYEFKLVLDIPLRPDVVGSAELPALKPGEPGSTRS